MKTKRIQDLVENQTKPVNKSACILQLERNNHTLSLWRKKLTSYVYEPKTSSLFEQSEVLKSHMDRLKDANTEILNSLKERKNIVSNEIDHAITQFKAINELEQIIENYMTNVRNC